MCKASFTHSNIPEMCLCCHTCSSLFYLLMSSTTTDKNTTSPGDGHLGGVQFLTIMDKRNEGSCTNLFVNTFFQSFG